MFDDSKVSITAAQDPKTDRKVNGEHSSTPSTDVSGRVVAHPWFRLPTDLWRDPGFLALGPSARDLYLRAMSYVADQMTDGVLDAQAMRMLRPRKRDVQQLLDGDWWQRVSEDSTGAFVARLWRGSTLSRGEIVARRTEEKQRLRDIRTRVRTSIVRPLDLELERREEISSEERDLNSKTARAPETAPPEPESAPRADLIGFHWYVQTLGLLPTSTPALESFRSQYAWIGSKPAHERSAVAAAIQSDQWCKANKHIVDPEHIRKRWQRYLGGAPKPVVRANVSTHREDLDAARERLSVAQRQLNQLENAPWFDKEEKGYPSWLSQARNELAQAKARVSELMRDERVRAAS